MKTTEGAAERLESPGSGVGRLLTIREAAALTSLSRSMIYKLIYCGVLRRVRLPGCAKLLIAESELNRYIAAGIAAGCAPLSA